MDPSKFCHFLACVKFCSQVHATILVSGAVDPSDPQNVTKIKRIRPCVHELEPKMRVILGFLSVTFDLPGYRLPSISPKVNEIEF